MEKEMRKSAQIDEAFKAIKTETGISDVQEMVKKFLTREQTYLNSLVFYGVKQVFDYSMLLSNVSESEAKIDALKKDNEHLRSRLHDLNIEGNIKLMLSKKIKNIF